MADSRRVALVTCAEAADAGWDDDAPLLVAALATRGLHGVGAVWDDPAIDWAGFDLTVVRSTWDYVPRREEFLAWADSVPRLRNGADILRWNTDKRYLSDLAEAGVPVVRTQFIEPGAAFGLPSEGDYVVKPAVSAGGRDTARYGGGDLPAAQAQVASLLAAGRTVMVQPYLDRVKEEGETSVVYLGGAFSHAARKGELLTGPGAAVDRLDDLEVISPRTPRPEELSVAEQVLAAVPADLLYARVDLLPDEDGSPVLLELELTEPSLFLNRSPGAADRFAEAIARTVDEVAAQTWPQPAR